MRQAVQQWAANIKLLSWAIPDTISVGNVTHMTNLLNRIVPSALNSNPNLYGYSFLFNTQSNSTMGLDGYDNYQAPLDSDSRQLYWRRMWTGGQFEYHKDPPRSLQTIDCLERVSSVRQLKENTFVQIERNFSYENSPFMRELRTIVYLNEPFRDPSIGNDNFKIDQFDKSFVTKFSLQDIMRYNFLTYNLHKIHYDRVYCRQEGFEDVIVSGPFMVLVLLHYFASEYPGVKIKSFKYKNSKPCYIDRDVSLGIKKDAKGFELYLHDQNHIICSGRIEKQ